MPQPDLSKLQPKPIDRIEKKEWGQCTGRPASQGD